MAKRIKRDPGEMFAELGNTLDTPEPDEITIEPDEPTVLEPDEDQPKTVKKKRRGRTKTGKRSDPDYMQTGMFLPIKLVNRVKGHLQFEGKRRTIGDLSEELLSAWVAKQDKKLKS